MTFRIVTLDRKQKTGKKQPLKSHQLQTLRDLLMQDKNWRDLALLNLAVDTCLRGFDLLNLRVEDVLNDQDKLLDSFLVETSKTNKVVKCTLQAHTTDVLKHYLNEEGITSGYLFPAKKARGLPLSKVQYYRLVKNWVARLGLDPNLYGTHSLRRTRVASYYEQTKDIRTCQIALGHAQITQTAEYLGIEENEAIENLKKFQI